MPRYWVGVVSKNHVLRGVEGNFCQVCHGKGGPLNRMKKGDYLLYYSPKYDMIIDDKAYQVEQFEGFFPFRRNVEYYLPVKDCSIEIARQHPEWKNYTSRLRYGHFEVSKDFFLYIFHHMKVDDEA